MILRVARESFTKPRVPRDLDDLSIPTASKFYIVKQRRKAKAGRRCFRFEVNGFSKFDFFRIGNQRPLQNGNRFAPFLE